jgi:hypothetical protein
MFAFSPSILQEAIQKLKHNHGTATVSYHSTNLLWAKPKYVQCFITRIFYFIYILFDNLGIVYIYIHYAQIIKQLPTAMNSN